MKEATAPVVGRMSDGTFHVRLERRGLPGQVMSRRWNAVLGNTCWNCRNSRYNSAGLIHESGLHCGSGIGRKPMPHCPFRARPDQSLPICAAALNVQTQGCYKLGNLEVLQFVRIFENTRNLNTGVRMIQPNSAWGTQRKSRKRRTCAIYNPTESPFNKLPQRLSFTFRFFNHGSATKYG